MQGKSHLERRGCGPTFRVERLLEGRGCANGVSRAGEDGEEAIPLPAALDDDPVVLLDAGEDQRIVAPHSSPHRVGILLPELGAGLDVSQKEGDGAGWQVGHNRPPGTLSDATEPIIPAYQPRLYRLLTPTP